MKTLPGVLTLLLLTTISACSTMAPSADNIADTQKAILGSWTLEKSSALPEIPANILVTLRNDSHNKSSHENASSEKIGVSGFSGVNHFVGNAKVDWKQQKLAFSALASTRMMGPEPRMQFEQAFLKQMEQVVSFKLNSSEKLTLLTGDGDKIVFERGAQ